MNNCPSDVDIIDIIDKIGMLFDRIAISDIILYPFG